MFNNLKNKKLWVQKFAVVVKKKNLSKSLLKTIDQRMDIVHNVKNVRKLKVTNDIIG